MSILTGKEALIALANGEEVQIESNKQWVSVDNCQVYQFLNRDCSYKFRLKPRTITINGVEVPAPFEPKEGDIFWHIYPGHSTGYHEEVMQGTRHDQLYSQFGAWRTEEEIRQVVAALRQVLGGAQ